MVRDLNFQTKLKLVSLTKMEETSESLSKKIKEKEEILRKLKMVKLHRVKHSTEQLESLIKEWTGICQQALQDLHQKLTEQGSDTATVGISELLRHLNIEPELVGYCMEDEAFTN